MTAAEHFWSSVRSDADAYWHMQAFAFTGGCGTGFAEVGHTGYDHDHSRRCFYGRIIWRTRKSRVSERFFGGHGYRSGQTCIDAMAEFARRRHWRVNDLRAMPAEVEWNFVQFGAAIHVPNETTGVIG